MGPTVRLPKNHFITSTVKVHLPIPSLSIKATKTHIFKDLRSASLISIGQICDNDCLALFSKFNLKIFNKNGKTILSGTLNTADGLWDVNLTDNKIITDQQNTFTILRIDKRKADLATYLHSCCFSPTKKNFIYAIKKGYLSTWPGLTMELISKHLHPNIATTKGRIRQEQKNIHPTTKLNFPSEPPTIEETSKIANPDNQLKTHDCFITITTKEEGTSFSDLTGQYPIISSRGNKYILVLYDYDSNSIQIRALKTR